MRAAPPAWPLFAPVGIVTFGATALAVGGLVLARRACRCAPGHERR